MKIGSGRRRRRHLLREEETLWRQVAATIEPLPGKSFPEVPEPPTPPIQDAAPQHPAVVPIGKTKSATPPPLAPVEARLRQRLTRGTVDIDARIDLHGMRQDEAHGRLLRFLGSAQAEGAKIVLVITGKGKAAPEDGPLFGPTPGVLRRAVPLWLAAPELRPTVLGFEEAGPTHGGAGALYVRLRRRRKA